jgi:hypothetical protein
MLNHCAVKRCQIDLFRYSNGRRGNLVLAFSPSRTFTLASPLSS